MLTRSAVIAISVHLSEVNLNNHNAHYYCRGGTIASWL